MTRDQKRAWQKALNAHGFNCGTVDGIIGPKTLAAIEQCKDWQRWLNRNGFGCGLIDGWPGPLFDKALKVFQGAAGITKDGVVGPNTRQAQSDWLPPQIIRTVEGKLVLLCRQWAAVRTPYVFGHEEELDDATPEALDCSEAIQLAYWQSAHVLIADGSWLQYDASVPIVGPPEIGDLVFKRTFRKPNPKASSPGLKVGVSHVGIYIGNDQVFEAKGRDYGTIISNYSSNWKGQSNFLGARRFMPWFEKRYHPAV